MPRRLLAAQSGEPAAAFGQQLTCVAASDC